MILLTVLTLKSIIKGSWWEVDPEVCFSLNRIYIDNSHDCSYEGTLFGAHVLLLNNKGVEIGRHPLPTKTKACMVIGPKLEDGISASTIGDFGYHQTRNPKAMEIDGVGCDAGLKIQMYQRSQLRDAMEGYCVDASGRTYSYLRKQHVVDCLEWCESLPFSERQVGVQKTRYGCDCLYSTGTLPKEEEVLGTYITNPTAQDELNQLYEEAFKGSGAVAAGFMNYGT